MGRGHRTGAASRVSRAGAGPRVVTPFLYTAASKSKLAFDFLAAVNAGRVRVHRESGGVGVGLLEIHGERGSGGDAEALRRELFTQAGAARYELQANRVMRWGVPEREGHDDLLNALVLCVQAAPGGAPPVARGRSDKRA